MQPNFDVVLTKFWLVQKSVVVNSTKILVKKSNFKIKISQIL